MESKAVKILTIGSIAIALLVNVIQSTKFVAALTSMNRPAFLRLKA